MALFAATFCNTCVSQLRFGLFFIPIRFQQSLIHFRCTERNGHFAVLVKMVLLMIMIIAVFLVYVVGMLT